MTGTLPLDAAARPPVTASVVLEALALRHSGDVFVPECKNGPTQGASHRRFDAWVLLKTWSPINTIGYEIKVSRSDWRRDDKIEDYLPLCHRFFIVAPKGIVPIEELPAGIGLLEMVGQHQRLVMRRKAVRREIELPGELMVYVLMCRAQITREHQFGGHSRIDTLRAWVRTADDRAELSRAVRRKIRTKFTDQENRLEAVQRRCDALDHVRQRMEELGFDPANGVSTWRVDARLKEMAGVIDTKTTVSIDRAIAELQQVRDRFEEIRTATDNRRAVTQ